MSSLADIGRAWGLWWEAITGNNPIDWDYQQITVDYPAGGSTDIITQGICAQPDWENGSATLLFTDSGNDLTYWHITGLPVKFYVFDATGASQYDPAQPGGQFNYLQWRINRTAHSWSIADGQQTVGDQGAQPLPNHTGYPVVAAVQEYSATLPTGRWHAVAAGDASDISTLAGCQAGAWGGSAPSLFTFPDFVDVAVNYS